MRDAATHLTGSDDTDVFKGGGHMLVSSWDFICVICGDVTHIAEKEKAARSKKRAAFG